MNIGLIGAGAIAHYLLKEMNQRQDDKLRINSIYVRSKDKYKKLEKEYGVTLYTDLQAFLDSNIDIVVEAANVEAVKKLLPAIIKKKDIVLISIGALVDKALLTDISHLAKASNHIIHLPSGAIGGLDLLQNANTLGTVTSVALTTRKPAHSLIDKPINEEKVIFEGKAVDAIKQFPKNINVSIVLSLAGLGIDKTTVKIIADPYLEQNVHQVDVIGEFGEASFTIKNNPLPSNPKTSYLAAMSILGTLKRINQNVRIGG